MKLPEKYFFGWTNFKWFVKELIKLGSDQPSFFSKKRIESGIAFGLLVWACAFWLIKKYTVMSTYDFVMWSAIPIAITGYTVSLIEKAKKEELQRKDTQNEDPK